MPQALLVAALLLPFALFAALGWTRRARWRELERRLDGRREPCGWFAPGAIVGAHFRVEVRKSGRAWRTEVSRRAAGTPGRFVLQPEFFQSGPNWSAAKVPGPRT